MFGRKDPALDSLISRADALEEICANISAGQYALQDRDEGPLGLPMMYLHTLAWAIGFDARAVRSDSRVRHLIEKGARRPIHRAREGEKPFMVDTDAYSSSDSKIAQGADVATIYEMLINSIPFSVSPLTPLPEEETKPLRVMALNAILSDSDPFFTERTAFPLYAKANRYPFEAGMVSHASSLMDALGRLADFDLRSLVQEYQKAFGAQDRPLMPDRLVMERREMADDRHSPFRKDDDQEYTIDAEHVEKILRLRDEVIAATQGGWGSAIKALADFHYESDPWNFLMYFEGKPDYNQNAKIIPSKMREEPNYVDYTGNLERIRDWMGKVREGLTTPQLALIGEPGTGKTVGLVTAAREAQLKVVSVDYEFVSGGYLPDLMRQVRKKSDFPFIIYIDNVDITEHTGAGRDEYFQRAFTMNLERAVEGPTTAGNMKFAMSTSTYDLLSKPLKQRFSNVLSYELPTAEQAREIAQAHIQGNDLEIDVDAFFEMQGEETLTPRQLRDSLIAFAYDTRKKAVIAQ